MQRLEVISKFFLALTVSVFLFMSGIGLPPLGSEKALEFNYGLQVKPYFLVQPVFQYYVDTGANPRIPNAAVFGFRMKVTF